VKILGLSFDYHDAAAALLVDGRIVAAAQEERFSRQKNDPGFPARAAAFCLAQAGLTGADLDAVAHYENPFVKFERVLEGALETGKKKAFNRTLDNWCRLGKLDVRGRIVTELGVPRDRIHFGEHHRSHAAAAFFCSPFADATVVTIDGVGERETMTVSAARGTTLSKRYTLELPHSLGLFYSAMTAFLGFKVNSGEYKVMGMAGFGQPRLVDQIRELVRLTPEGALALDPKYFDFVFPEARVPFTDALTRLLGAPRVPESPFDLDDPACRHYADIAASAQAVTEEAIFHMVETAVEKTGLPDVVLAGGVALNSLANGKLQNRLAGRLYVYPAAGDGGSALGAALDLHHASGGARSRSLVDPFLGKAYGRAAIDEALEVGGVDRFTRYEDRDELLRVVAEHLAAGSVVGWFQGRFEWGPRALGHRSILADPTGPEMQALINEKIKFREPFRPFAPAVLSERAAEYFDVPEPYGLESPEHFMLTVADVHPDKRPKIPAVTHVDGSARVQRVSRDTNPLFADLITAFEKEKGVPMLVNTSFNLRGEPIVASPMDALKTFFYSDMDYVVLGGVVVGKEALSWA